MPLTNERFVTLIATWFGSGLSPKAPGTMGSLAALPIVAVLIYFKAPQFLLFLTFMATFGGVWATKHYLIYSDKEGDPKEVVIDEVAGQWLTCFLLLIVNSSVDYAAIAVGFVAFRFFDILKPWPISWIDKNVKGAWGVMLDDIAAAFMAVAACIVLFVVFGMAYPCNPGTLVCL